MGDFEGLPLHAQNALLRAGVKSAEQARSLGRDALSQVPGLGPLAISRLFQSSAQQPRQHILSSDDLRRVKRWFDALQEAAPMKLNDGDGVLAEKIAAWID